MRLLEARGVGCTRGGRPILSGVDLRVASGEFVGLVGPNGAGKTTLLRVLAGLEPATDGTVRSHGEPLASVPPATRARRLGYHPQNPELHWPLTVADILALGRLPHDADAAADRAAIARAVARTGLDALLARHGDTLSGGELARVHIARLLAGEHRTLLTDEPIANLDPRYQLEILGLLREHADGGGATVVVLHDLAAAARFCDRLLLLDRGRVQAVGRPAEVLSGERLARVFGVGPDYRRLSGIEAALGDRLTDGRRHEPPSPAS